MRHGTTSTQPLPLIDGRGRQVHIHILLTHALKFQKSAVKVVKVERSAMYFSCVDLEKLAPCPRFSKLGATWRQENASFRMHNYYYMCVVNCTFSGIIFENGDTVVLLYLEGVGLMTKIYVGEWSTNVLA